MYYNTNNLKESELVVASKKTEKQKDIVKSMFLKRKTKMTASEVHRDFPKLVPITSIRRAMSDLKNEGILKRTELLTEGLYGSPEHYYELSTGQLSIF